MMGKALPQDRAYFGSDEWVEAATRAEGLWEVIEDYAWSGGRYVTAKSGTGTRTVVIVTVLPTSVANREGGRYLVTVLSPWNCSWPIGEHGTTLHLSYLGEKFTEGKFPERTHAGELVAMGKTVCHALDRTYMRDC